MIVVIVGIEAKEKVVKYLSWLLKPFVSIENTFALVMWSSRQSVPSFFLPLMQPKMNHFNWKNVNQLLTALPGQAFKEITFTSDMF